jgi:hypothetical protein
MGAEIRNTGMARPTAAWIPIVVAGLATSGLTLSLLWSFGEELNFMGLYVLFVVPAGALVAGLGAGSGYGLASWKLGTKIGKGLLVVVVALQVAVYFAAQYVEYLGVLAGLGEEGVGYGFFAYVDEMTRSFAFEESDALGGAGYAFRALEILGFAAGGAIAPALLRSKPYCDVCGRYMRSKALGAIPAGGTPPSRWRRSAEAKESHAEAQEEAWNEGLARLERLQAMAAEGDLSGVQSLVFELSEEKRRANAVQLRIVATLHGCPRCGDGFVKAQAHTGHGDQLAVTELGSTRAAPDVVKHLV